MEDIEVSYSRIACVGTGLCAIALGATLKRWYGIDDIQFFERETTSGGTWWVNSYPGCACDVPSALYSFSFELNPRWTRLMPSNNEIKAYHDGVVSKYDLLKKMRFRTEVTRCLWNETSSTWTMHLVDLDSGKSMIHVCSILFSATGALVNPNPCTIPGNETFEGDIFDSSRWRHNVDLTNKRIVVIGNGCTAAQIVPAIVRNAGHLTQIVRSKHWVFPSHNISYPKLLIWILTYVPFAMRLHRLMIFLIAENDFRLFPMTSAAARLRRSRQESVEKYMRKTAPAKYHDLLIPDFEVGCKRRIFDCGYLESLHAPNYMLTDDKIVAIEPQGIRTANGFVPADVIVLATGFQTNEYLQGLVIQGKNEETIQQHWEKFPGPEAYNTSVLSGFPNFFMLLGPNAATGHTSALMAAENSINYALRVLKPVLERKAKAIDISSAAEEEYVYAMQEELKNRVWNAGCRSWYIKGDNSWNSMSYPWSQGHFWYRSLFPVWSDWMIKEVGDKYKRVQKPLMSLRVYGLLAIGLTGAIFSNRLLGSP
ncbi:monooxygenase [Stagonosporopsis vannaccii]|nr:monooxygenase [Stagonosporopsis vannaccii]